MYCKLRKTDVYCFEKKEVHLSFALLFLIVLPGNGNSMIRQGIGMGHVVILISIELGQRVMEWGWGHGKVGGEHTWLVPHRSTPLLRLSNDGTWFRAYFRLLDRGQGVLG